MTDVAFRAWIQTLPSCITGRYSEWYAEVGEWRCVAAHVRRAGRSGIAFKEAYACVPLTSLEHDYQHQHGELACLLRFGGFRGSAHIRTVEDAKAWFDAKADYYREKWFEIAGNADFLKPIEVGEPA